MVEIEHVVTHIRCGETVLVVREHGHEGSGAWAAWSGGSIIYNTNRPHAAGSKGYTREWAIDDAIDQAKRIELSRRLRVELNNQLLDDQVYQQ